MVAGIILILLFFGLVILFLKHVLMKLLQTSGISNFSSNISHGDAINKEISIEMIYIIIMLLLYVCYICMYVYRQRLTVKW